MGKGHECETCEFKGRCDGFVCQNKLAEDSGEELKINVIENLPNKHDRVCIKCATCENFIDLWRGKFPICDDCLKALREIIKERRLEKEKEKK